METKRYRITNPESPFYGLVGSCEMIYYDHQHTGDSPDLVQLRLEDGRGVRMFSTSVEEVIEEPAETAPSNDKSESSQRYEVIDRQSCYYGKTGFCEAIHHDINNIRNGVAYIDLRLDRGPMVRYLATELQPTDAPGPTKPTREYVGRRFKVMSFRSNYYEETGICAEVLGYEIPFQDGTRDMLSLRMRGGFGATVWSNEVEEVVEQPATPPRPTIVCLCGSSRFGEAFRDANLRETLDGKIVLTIGCDTKSDDQLFSYMAPETIRAIKDMLDELHLRKIDLADEVLMLNVDGYLGDSSRRELAYARAAGKRIRWLEPDKALGGADDPA